MRQEKSAETALLLGLLVAIALFAGLRNVGVWFELHRSGEAGGLIPAFRRFAAFALPACSAGFVLVAVSLWNRSIGDFRRRWLAILVFGLSIFLFLATVQNPPIFSDDIYRYLWEGHVIAEGKNPFELAPDSPELEFLRRNIPGIYDRINHPHISAIYPPLAQFIFAAAALASLGITGIKFLFSVMGIFFAGFFLLKWCREEKIPDGRLFSLIFLPLLWLEIPVSGHLDVLLILGAAICFYSVSFYQKRETFGWLPVAGAGAGLAIAVLSKTAPIVLLPHLALQFRGWHHRAAILAGVPAVCLAAHAPFLGAGEGLFHAGGIYTRIWEHNGGAYRVMESILTAADPDGRAWGGILGSLGLSGRVLAVPGYDSLHPNLFGARALLGALFAVVWGLMLWRRDAFDRQWLIVLGAGLLLSPVVHPWYLLALVPACLRGGVFARAVFWWALAIPFTYVMLPLWWADGIWRQPAWTFWLQYGGLILVVVFSLANRRYLENS